MQPHRMRFRCWPINIDRNAHMNNAKYTRLTNYARRAFWQQNGAWDVCTRRTPKANMIVTALSTRYRKELSFMEAFDIVTSLLSWDSTCMYVEHRFVNSDSFVCAVCLVKYRLLCADQSFTPSALLAACDPTMEGRPSPPPTPELSAWMEYDQRSSAALRPRKPV
uniref:Thioesterase domain-containing protein n=1 Tax=Haptolina brevifila TaxID=156173 RepID=A0A7S2GRQ6_9EUKA|mmetsp:Transcript_4613/g.9929  ORF Transcript_4613/g.9929 Transcript_4613/m.9929 type:complete len:165 (+) Transcript_4613:245-739(+)